MSSFQTFLKSKEPFSWFLALLIALAALASPTYGTIVHDGAFAPDFYKTLFYHTALPLFSIVLLWRYSSIRLDALSLSAILMFSWVALSLLWVFHKGLAWIALSRFLAGGATLFLALQLVRSQKSVHYSLIILVVMSALLSLLGLTQHYATIGGIFEWFGNLVPQAIPPASTFGNRNMAMHVLVLTFPLCVLFFLYFKNYYSILFALIGAVLLAHLFHSENRTSWISLILEASLMLFFFFYNQRKSSENLFKLSSYQKAALIASLLLFLVLTSFDANGNLQFFVENIAERVKPSNFSGNTENSLKHRFILYALTLFELFPDHWFKGVGVGNWTVYFPYYTGHYHLIATMDASNPGSNILYKQTHNDYLQWLAEFGLIGVLLAGLFLGVFFWRTKRLLVSSGSYQSQHLFWQMPLVGLFGIAVNLGASFPFRVSIPMLIISFYFAVISYYARKVYTSIEKDEPSSSKKTIEKYTLLEWRLPIHWLVSAFLTLALLTLSFMVFKVEHRWIEAQKMRNYGAVLIRSGLNAMGIDALKRSLKLNPTDPDDALYTLGNALEVEKREGEAIEVFKHLLKDVLPWHPYARVRLAEAYLRQNRNQEATEFLKESINALPKQSIFYVLLGDLKVRSAQEELGVQYLEKALLLNTQVPSRNAIAKYVTAYRERHKKPYDLLTRDLKNP